MLDALSDCERLFPMETSGNIKVIGQLRSTPWQRFDKLQRTLAKFPRRNAHPKGVYRFASHEDANQWKAAIPKTKA
ncbi:hypothetical protein [Geminisphaera colitermitum]|uniref:hypothetical protein n=1 Tax=Geminisphaera colitermitum TaxID=1148786 RepID=UPI0001965105|nr:hypothetical protein [Geminisphaera colitermitum]